MSSLSGVVLGIDFGNEKCVLATIQRGNVELLDDQASERYLPSMISFGNRERLFGEQAKNQLIRLPQETISNIKRLLGQRYNSKEFQKELQYMPATLKTLEGKNGRVDLQVKFHGQDLDLSVELVCGMLLKKLKQIAEKKVGKSQNFCVISVPPYFTDTQRRALLDAAEIAGLNVLRLLNDPTASILQYSFYKTNLPKEGESPHKVVFFDMGHTSTLVSLAKVWKGKIEIVNTQFDRDLGGRDFNQILFDHFSKQILEQFQLDLNQRQNAKIRLMNQVDSVKKALSTNSETVLLIEGLIDDKDFTSKITREEFENLCSNLLKRSILPLERLFEDSKFDPKEVDIIELVGGSSRIPAIQDILTNFFGKPLSKTVNASDSVAVGCALQSAFLSPSVMTLQKMVIEDKLQYGISMKWKFFSEGQSESESGNSLLFPKGEIFPCSKSHTFYTPGPFELLLEYEHSQLPPGFSSSISKYVISELPSSFGEDAKIKVNVRINTWGTVELESVFYQDSTREISLRFTSSTFSLSTPELNEAIEQEHQLSHQDKLILEFSETRNNLESYLYDVKGRYEVEFVDYMSSEERNSIKEKLQEIENFLLEIDQSEKNDFINISNQQSKLLKELKDIFEPIRNRHREHNEIPVATSELKDSINKSKQTSKVDDKRIPIKIVEEKKKRILDEAEDAEHWLEQLMKKHQNVPKNVDPVVKASTIQDRKQTLEDLRKSAMKNLKRTSNVEDLLNSPKKEKLRKLKKEIPNKENNAERVEIPSEFLKPLFDLPQSKAEMDEERFLDEEVEYQDERNVEKMFNNLLLLDYGSKKNPSDSPFVIQLEEMPSVKNRKTKFFDDPINLSNITNNDQNTLNFLKLQIATKELEKQHLQNKVENLEATLNHLKQKINLKDEALARFEQENLTLAATVEGLALQLSKKEKIRHQLEKRVTTLSDQISQNDLARRQLDQKISIYLDSKM